jgi:nitrite reductase (NO-forming)
MKKIKFGLLVGLSIPVLLLSACGEQPENTEQQDAADKNVMEVSTQVFAPHEGVNQEPVPLEMERDGTDVFVKMTAQIIDIQLDKDTLYKAWTFNGEAPGPVVVVNEGDTIHFTLDNMDPAVPHSMDFHAVHTAPNVGFADVMPNEEGTFAYKANSPGVFMYHCGTAPVIAHIANGMHGVIIVKPADGYPTDDLVDKEFVIVQNEWYDYNNMEDMIEGEPNQVVFSAKALEEGQINTNGTVGALTDTPLEAKVGDRIRFYINNVGPNELSSFHVIGTIMEDVYIDGHPANHLKGMQTVGLPASGGAVVEFVVKEPGEYKFVTHQFEHVEKGAVGKIIVTE